MNKNKIIITFLSFFIVIVICLFGYKIIMGRDGVIKKYSSVESEFDKEEVLEKLYEQVKAKYMQSYNEAKNTSDKKLEDLYNVDIAISYLVENKIIENYYYISVDENSKKYAYLIDEKDTTNALKRDDCFYINVNNINEVQTYGKGEKYTKEEDINKKNVFLLEKKQEGDTITYIVNYYNNQGIKDEIGILKIEKPLD